MSTPSSAAKGSPSAHILALDYGRARIGLAIASAGSAVARPLSRLDRINRNEDMRRIREIARKHGVTQIVVGLPLRLDGTRGEMAEEAARFARRVHKELGLPVEMVDERLTSWDAERQLEEQQGRAFHAVPAHVSPTKHRAKRQERPSVDAMAAAIILKEYLDRPRADSGPSGSR